MELTKIESITRSSVGKGKVFELFEHLFLVTWNEIKYFLPSTITVRFAFAGTGSPAVDLDVLVAVFS